MTDRELMQQALEALNHVNVQDRVQIITALRSRLAQQEPVAWEVGVVNGVVTRRLAQPEQEPTAERAWFTIAELNAWADKKLSENPHWVMPKDKPERDEPPPQRKPLTDEEIEDLYFDKFSMGELKAFARAIEAAHGITGDKK
jgi:hypothetical protein